MAGDKVGVAISGFGNVEDGTLLDLIGSVQLGSFRILRRLGVGGFATAFLAEQVGVERLAVVKVGDPRVFEDDAGSEARARFEEEVLATTRVTHPNLVTVYVAGSTTNGLPAYAMEYVPGFTMERRMQHCSALPSPELLAYFTQLADVIRVLHRAGIHHRDVSPGNVIVSADSDGAPKATLLDLGISRSRGSASPVFVAGTPRYVAPEQLRGATTTASDIFGLGSLLYWCVTGAELFWDASSSKEVLERTLAMTRAPLPSVARPILPDEVDSLVSQMLDPNPRQRPTAEEVLARLPKAVRALERSAAKATVRAFRAVRAEEREKPPTILCIGLNELQLEPVRKHAAATGWELEVSQSARDATRASDGQYKLGMLNAELPSPSVASLVAHLREFQPKSAIAVVFARKPQAGALETATPDLSLELPKDGLSLFWFLRALQPDGESDDE